MTALFREGGAHARLRALHVKAVHKILVLLIVTRSSKYKIKNSSKNGYLVGRKGFVDIALATNVGAVD